MISTEKQQKGAELLNILFDKAWNDDAFKQQLIDNPITSIEGITGKSFMMPENKKLIVDDQTDESVIYLNIPHKPNMDEMELTDEQLEQVAGGEFFGTALTVIAVCSIAYSAYTGVRDGLDAQ